MKNWEATEIKTQNETEEKNQKQDSRCLTKLGLLGAREPSCFNRRFLITDFFHLLHLQVCISCSLLHWWLSPSEHPALLITSAPDYAQMAMPIWPCPWWSGVQGPALIHLSNWKCCHWTPSEASFPALPDLGRSWCRHLAIITFRHSLLTYLHFLCQSRVSQCVGTPSVSSPKLIWHVCLCVFVQKQGALWPLVTLSWVFLEVDQCNARQPASQNELNWFKVFGESKFWWFVGYLLRCVLRYVFCCTPLSWGPGYKVLSSDWKQV